MKLILYCTKSKPYLMKLKDNKYHLSRENKTAEFVCEDYIKRISFNGKIVAECDFEVEEIKEAGDEFEYYCYTENLLESELLKKSCLTEGQLYGYLENGTGYAIHIKNLHIFDEPRELKNSGYKVRDRKNDKEMQIFKVDEWQPIAFKYIEKAPQNMCKVYRLNDNEEEYNEYILISIKPEWLFKILNKEKTIEVRKKVLKEMIK